MGAGLGGPDGRLYVSDLSKVVAFDGQTGAVVRTYSGAWAVDMAFGPDGALYLAHEDDVLRLNVTDGTTSVFGQASRASNLWHGAVAFGLDGDLYVMGSTFSDPKDVVARFDGSTGQFKGQFITSSHFGWWRDITFGSEGDLYVAELVTNEVIRFVGPLGATPGKPRQDPFAVLKASNVAPVINGVTLEPVVTEGGSMTLQGQFDDPGLEAGFQLVVDWGDGPAETIPLASGVRTFSVSHRYRDDAPGGTSEDVYRVALQLRDADGATTTQGPLEILVRNAAPSVSITGAPADPREGQAITLRAAVSDPAPADTFTYQWTVTRNGAPLAVEGTTNQEQLTFRPTDEGLYLVTLEVADDDGGVAVGARNLNVANQAPQALSLSVASTRLTEDGFIVEFRGAFTELPADSVHGGVSFGEETFLPLVATSTGGGTVLDYAYSAKHVFTRDGTMQVAITVADENGASSTRSTELKVDLPPRTLLAQVNNGESQRSRLSSLALQFSEGVGASLSKTDFHLRNLTTGTDVAPGYDAASVELEVGEVPCTPKLAIAREPAAGDQHKITLTFTPCPGKTHSVEFRDSLSAGSWQPLPGGPHNGGLAAESSDVPIRFYRVRVQ